MAKRTTGVVRWFDGSRGYGYIDAKDGEEVFVHYSALEGIETPLLLKGEEVVFFPSANDQWPPSGGRITFELKIFSHFQ